ncbi:uncharacterized protein N7443_005557 [Penicillium atrosanguineum]|uniref:uncharacterized protein n=1 Tax=Penicillium atrosanguineum TaxID=1132637 RepID=UPI002384A7A1|nr:uncharacterized protein N7443_005557 [Penicillium atrosanguineum]KAJ5300555.1 hypothetical protein N7443_005557 [Penicillium atrosanguineum]
MSPLSTSGITASPQSRWYKTPTTDADFIAAGRAENFASIRAVYRELSTITERVKDDMIAITAFLDKHEQFDTPSPSEDEVVEGNPFDMNVD